MDKMNTFSKIPLGACKDSEFFQVGDQVLAAVASNNAEALKLRGVSNLFAESLDVARSKVDTVKKHPLSGEISELYLQIDNLLMAVININRGHKKAVTSDLKTAAELTVPFIEKSFKGLQTMNNYEKSECLLNFFKEMDSNTALISALVALSLKPLLDDLRLKRAELIAKKALRNKEKLPSVTETKLLQVQQAKNLFRKLLSTIETNALVEKDLDYKPLIDIINNILAEANKLVNMRRAAQDNQEGAKNTTAPVAANLPGTAVTTETSTASSANSL
jgi:hypothetical protein